MNRRYFKLIVILIAAVSLSGCSLFKKKALKEPTFKTSGVSVATLAPGETTTILGEGFGAAKGQVFLGDTEAQVKTWKNDVIRIIIPKVEKGTYDINVAPPETKKKFVKKVAIRDAVRDELDEWVEGQGAIDSAAMEPLIIILKPTGSPQSGSFDFKSNVPKSADDLISEVESAFHMGVQAVELYFPADRTSSAEDYSDLSMDNIRYIVKEIARRCPGMIIMLDDVFMLDGNRRISRLLKDPSMEVVYNIGSFQEPDASDMRLTEIKDADAASSIINGIYNRNRTPLLEVMTSWQAFDIQQLALSGLSLPSATFLLNMSVDKRAVNNKKTYQDIKSLMPDGSRIIAAAVGENVTQIIGYAISGGDHVAIGLNYATFWPGNSSNYIQSNLFMVEKTIQVAEGIKRPLATLKEARELLGIIDKPRVNDSSFKVTNLTEGRPKTIYVKRGRNRIAVLDSLPSNSINYMASSYDGKETWLATDSGVYLTDDDVETFQKISPGKYGLPTAIAATSDNGVWFGTPGYGILKTTDRGSSFSRYNIKTESLIGEYITCMYGYDNEIYACVNGTEEGNPGKGIAYTTDSGENWYLWSAKHGLPFDSVRAVHVEDEWVYVGFGPYKTETEAAGMAVSNDFGKTWSMVKGISVPVLSINVWDGNLLLVGTKGGGAFMVDYNGSGARPITAVQHTETVRSIHIDSRGWIWIATDTEVLVSDDGANKFRSFTTEDGIGSTFLTGCETSPNGDVLISTKQDGDFPGGLTKISVSKATPETPEAAQPESADAEGGVD